jgi:hypothetical protein
MSAEGMAQMSEPTLALRSSMLTAIDAIVSCEVYDAVPQGAAYPYVTFDYQTIDNEDYLGGFRVERRFVYLGVWSRTTGAEEVLSIMSQLDALNEQPLTLSTGDMVSLRVERKRTIREPDNLTYQGQITLRIITTH